MGLLCGCGCWFAIDGGFDLCLGIGCRLAFAVGCGVVCLFGCQGVLCIAYCGLVV